MRWTEGCRASGGRLSVAVIAVLLVTGVPLAVSVIEPGEAAAYVTPHSDAAQLAESRMAANQPPPSCGATIYKANDVPWRCTFDDEFNGTSLDTANWVSQLTSNSGYTSGGECYTGSANNVSVSGGTLNLTVRREAAPFTCIDPYGNYTTQYTGGMVTTDGKFSQTYGLFEVRAELPAATVQGIQESFWLWPVNDTKFGATWPASGEIDFAEMYSLYPDLDVPYIHYNAASTDPNVTTYNCTIADPTQFHTYGLEWTSSSISVLLDGKPCLTDSWHPAAPLVQPAPFNQPFFLNLTQALGITTNAFKSGTTPLPGTTHIDWVRIWS